MKDVSTGTRREVIGVRSADDMLTAAVWIRRGGIPDGEIHCYLRADGSFGVWMTSAPADRSVPGREDVCARV